MSSGRFTSSLFSCSFFKMVSRLLSTGGFGTFSCCGFFSSWEPKLLGRVLLRCRVRGGRSSSDFISLLSVEERRNTFKWAFLVLFQRVCRGVFHSSALPFCSLRSLASSLSHRSTSGFPALSLWEGWIQKAPNKNKIKMRKSFILCS